jgi:hypothetical protein
MGMSMIVILSTTFVSAPPIGTVSMPRVLVAVAVVVIERAAFVLALRLHLWWWGEDVQRVEETSQYQHRSRSIGD